MPAAMTFRDNKIRLLIFFGVVLLLSLTMYRSFLYDLIVYVLRRDESSHGLFVPFISAFFLWKLRGRLQRTEPQYKPAPGLLLIMGGLLLFYFSSTASPEVALPAISYFVTMAGFIIMIFGWRVFKAISFPFFFLLTMIPLPEQLYDKLAEWLRETSTAGAIWIARICGVPLVRDGYLIDLPNVKLVVNRSCSGIRYLISYFVFGLAYAFYFRRTIQSRSLVVLATIPISIIASVIRLSTIILSAYYIGAFMAHYIEHLLISWFVFAGILTVVILIDRRCAT